MIAQDLSVHQIARGLAAFEGRSVTCPDDYRLALYAHQRFSEMPEQSEDEWQRAHDAAAELFSKWWPDGRVVDGAGRPIAPVLA